MNHDIFQFAAPFVGAFAKKIPEYPSWDGDVPSYRSLGPISIMSVPDTNTITWIKPNGLNVLVADRVLLSNVSWLALETNQFIQGQLLSIESQNFLARLPHAGTIELTSCGWDCISLNEWDQILDITGDYYSLWHWSGIYFWSGDWDGESQNRVVRGWTGPRHWCQSEPNHQSHNVGFRPALEIFPDIYPKKNCVLEGMDFQMTSIPGSMDFCPVIQPIRQDVFANIPNGHKVHMYTLLENGHPVHPDDTFRDKACLKLSDKYFGNEYLIPWTISNGMAVADKAILHTT